MIMGAVDKQHHKRLRGEHRDAAWEDENYYRC
jgi:hypothetical protein